MASRDLQIILVLAIPAVALFAGCGGSESTGPGPGPAPTRSISIAAGDNQTARIGSAVLILPAVVVRDGNNQPVTGFNVTFAVETGGGSVTGATATTNASGVATVGNWTLGSSAGTNTLTATATGATGSPVRFTATARLPYWTVMVFMAADNNLATSGIDDIDEMEAAGFDPEVQVVVQAEFSPTYLSLEGCNAACFNRPNFNTFRYFFNGQGASVPGPNGTTIDIGNRNMIDHAQIHEFITWTKQNYPAQRYGLVLWNHGGGYIGLLQDLTSAGEGLMSIGDLPSALSGVGPIDVIDFDMCLMGGYETLAKLTGLTSFAVFSEEVEPGAGNPYRQILDGIQVNPNVDGRTVAGIVVDQFDASYQGSRASTTKSAYDLAQFAAFESALNTLAGTLRTNLATLATAIAQAAASGQAYEYPFLKDLVNLLDSLRVRTSDPTLLSQIDAVRAQTTSSFRVRSRFHNAAAFGANDVSRSNGLSVLMPSGGTQDRLPDVGPGSFGAYQTLYSGKAWTLFLADWLASQSTVAYRDQGNARFEGYLVWEQALVSRNGDVDIWILEPSGDLFIPYLGSVTPNGTLTNDSYYNFTYYEGYLTNRFVQVGTYKFYANLWTDPQDYRPLFDIQYRFDQVSPFISLYAPNYPRLSLQVSWLNDPSPTFAEADAGAYSDLQLAAVLDITAAAAATVSATTAAPAGAVAPAVTSAAAPELTSAQLATVQRLHAEGRVKSGSAQRRSVPSGLVPPPSSERP